MFSSSPASTLRVSEPMRRALSGSPSTPPTCRMWKHWRARPQYTTICQIRWRQRLSTSTRTEFANSRGTASEMHSCCLPMVVASAVATTPDEGRSHASVQVSTALYI